MSLKESFPLFAVVIVFGLFSFLLFAGVSTLRGDSSRSKLLLNWIEKFAETRAKFLFQEIKVFFTKITRTVDLLQQSSFQLLKLLGILFFKKVGLFSVLLHLIKSRLNQSCVWIWSNHHRTLILFIFLEEKNIRKQQLILFVTNLQSAMVHPWVYFLHKFVENVGP